MERTRLIGLAWAIVGLLQLVIIADTVSDEGSLTVSVASASVLIISSVLALTFFFGNIPVSGSGV